MRCVSFLFLLLILPGVVAAEEAAITRAEGPALSRAEGFRMIWEPLQRPIEETTEPSFTDVSEDHPQGALLTYAKSRGILDNAANFAPDDPLRLNDALLWLLRSRNVRDPGRIDEQLLPRLIARYPLTIGRQSLARNAAITREELTTLMERLDGALRSAPHAVSYYGTAFDGETTAFGERFNPAAMTAAHRTLPYNTLVRVTYHDVNCQLPALSAVEGSIVTHAGASPRACRSAPPTGRDPEHPAKGKEFPDDAAASSRACRRVNCQTRSVVVRINDRGPYVAGRDMDLSRAAFERLSPKSAGVLTNVTFERLGDYTTLKSHERSPRHVAKLRRDRQE